MIARRVYIRDVEEKKNQGEKEKKKNKKKKKNDVINIVTRFN